MNLPSIDTLSLRNKNVLIRLDFNVPIDQGKIIDDTRIVAALPTIRRAIEEGACISLISHLGRPDGKVVPKFSLQPVAEHLAQLLSLPVIFLKDCIGKTVKKHLSKQVPGSILLLENLRFHPGEEAGDPEFAQELASHYDVFINDAFGAAHRPHASVSLLPNYIAECAAGYLLCKEVEFLTSKLASPQRPFCVVLGGAKVSDKIHVINKFLEIADTMIIGGAMAYTFALAQGNTIGKSRAEEDKLQLASQALKKAKECGVQLLLPIDHLVTDHVDFNNLSVGEIKVTDANIPNKMLGVDIGPKTVELFKEAILGAATVLWNGPMGIFEIPACGTGTFQIAQAIVDSGAISIVGGGDSVNALKACGLSDKVTFISTGGGATLELLEGNILPGVEALLHKFATS